MNNIVPPDDPQSRIDNYIGYTSGITGSQAPGPCSAAYLLISPDGNELFREIMDTGIHSTGHDAEYLAVALLSRVVRTRFAHIKNLFIFCSDKLVGHQLSGLWQVRVARHQQFAEKIASNLKNIQWGIKWIPLVEHQLKDWHWENYKKSNEAGTQTGISQGNL
ncbi:MAG: hypothetical protein ACLP5H_17395 [Desulfomonilaceae bacterium]